MRTSALTLSVFLSLFVLCACGQTRLGASDSNSKQRDAGQPDVPAAAGTGTAGKSAPAAGTGTAGKSAPAAGSGTSAAGRAAAGTGPAEPAAGRGGPGAGTGGSGGAASGDCPKNLALPAICRACGDGSCGTPVCKDGKFSGEWACPKDENPSTSSCAVGGCSNQLCSEGSQSIGSTCEWREEYACYKSAKCERQSDGKCGWTQTPELTACLKNPSGGATNLHWFMTCGDPVCRADTTPFDDPNIPNCTNQKLGDACSTDGELCDGVASCGAKYICAAKGPTTCPISRARFKEAVEYLKPEQRREFRDQLLRMPLASYRYKQAPEAGPQLGFMIDDVEPSVAVSGDHVNMYGYLSMAVAAIQEQQQEIARLQRELAELRTTHASHAEALSCEP